MLDSVLIAGFSLYWESSQQESKSVKKETIKATAWRYERICDIAKNVKLVLVYLFAKSSIGILAAPQKILPLSNNFCMQESIVFTAL